MCVCVGGGGGAIIILAKKKKSCKSDTAIFYPIFEHVFVNEL